MGEQKFDQTVLVTWPRWPPCPYMVKALKKSSSLEPKGWWPWNLVCSIGILSTAKFVQMMTLDWPWPILQQGQIWSLMLLYGKKVKQWIFQKLLSSMIWNLQQWPKWQAVSIDIKMLSPGGSMPPVPGLCTCIKSWKIKFKIRLNRDFFETCNKLVKWLGLPVDIKILSPGGCLPPPRGYIYMYWIMKKLYKIRLFQRDLFETCNKWPKWQDAPVDIKISSQKCCQPHIPGLYTSIKSWKKLYKIQRGFFLNL